MAASAEASRSQSVGTRTVTPHTVQPGEEVTVRIELDGISGKLLVSEAVSEDDVLREVSPEPLDTVRLDDRLYVSWNLAGPADVAVEYTTAVADSATEGEVIPFEGSVVLAEEPHPVGGRTEIEVVTDFFERLRRQEEITHHDVEVASEYADSGEITHREFERIYRHWQNGSSFDTDKEYEPAVTAVPGNEREQQNTTGDHQPMSRQGTPADGQQRMGSTENRNRTGRRPRTNERQAGPPPRYETRSTTGGGGTSQYSQNMSRTLSVIPETVVMYVVYGVFSVVGFFLMAVLVDATADFVNIPAGGAVAFVAAALVTAGGVLATAMGTGDTQ